MNHQAATTLKAVTATAESMSALSADARSRFAGLCAVEPAGLPIPRTPLYTGILTILMPIFSTICRFRVEGIERIPRTGPMIMAGNHMSHVDPVIMIYSSRRKTYFLAKEAHFAKFGVRQFMHAVGQIETDRARGGGDAVARAADVLLSGNVLGIFPEGTRSRNKQAPFLQRGKTGVARLAAAFPDVPVVCAGIAGSHEFLAPGQAPLPRIWRPVTVRFGSPVTWAEWSTHPEGGAVDDAEVERIAALPEDEQRADMGRLYRKFTDQTIATLRALGAP